MVVLVTTDAPSTKLETILSMGSNPDLSPASSPTTTAQSSTDASGSESVHGIPSMASVSIDSAAAQARAGTFQRQNTPLGELFPTVDGSGSLRNNRRYCDLMDVIWWPSSVSFLSHRDVHCN